MKRDSRQFQRSWDETLSVLRRDFTFFREGSFRATTASWDCRLLREAGFGATPRSI